MEYLLDEVLIQIARRRRPLEKKHFRETLIPAGPQKADLPDNEGRQGPGSPEDEVFQPSEFEHLMEACALEVKRTFLCEAPSLRNQRSVVQSTTEHITRGVNPRRFQV